MTSPTPAELEQLKKDVDGPGGLKAQITGLKDQNVGLLDQIAALKKQKSVDNDVLLAKVFAQLAAVNAQLIKIDAQLFKVDVSALKYDERGLTFFGVPVKGTEKLSAEYWVKKLFNKPEPPQQPQPQQPRLAVARPGDVQAEAARAERLAALMRELERQARHAPAMERALRGVRTQARAAMDEVQRLENALR